MKYFCTTYKKSVEKSSHFISRLREVFAKNDDSREILGMEIRDMTAKSYGN